MQPAEHLAPETVEAFLRGTCGPESAREVELHIDGCDACRVLLSQLVRTHRNVGLHTTDVIPQPSPVHEGETIGTKYRVERVLGQGGMGSVVSAWHLQLNQRVALKFMLPALASDPQAVARFQREARAAVRLQTPHAGRVLDLDAMPDGTPFLVMEFLEGETLETRLAREKRVSSRQAVDWIRQALEALIEAHALGIVHRDFKPANLFLAKRPDGSEILKVLDFGIAKSAHPDIEQGLATTTSRVMVGSPPYMAPEQLNPGATVDARTDLWAVGVVLYQALSGEPPFRGNTLIDLMFAIQNRDPRPLSSLAPETPAALCRWVESCLAKSPEQRPASAAELLRGLEEAAVAPPASARPLPSFVRRRLVPGALALAAGLGCFFAYRLLQPPPPVVASAPAPSLTKAVAPEPAPPVALTARAAPAPAPAPVASASQPPPAPVPSRRKPMPSGSHHKPAVAPARPAPAPVDDVFGERR